MPPTALALKGSLLAAAAFALLVPTFNALNTSHFEAREPPLKLTPPTSFEPPPFEGERPDGEGEEIEIPLALNGAPCTDVGQEWQRVYRGETSPVGVTAQQDSTETPVRRGALGMGVLVNFTEGYAGDLLVTLQKSDGTLILDREAASRTGDPPRLPRSSWSREMSGIESGYYTFTWEAQPLAGKAGIDLLVAYPVCRSPAGAPS